MTIVKCNKETITFIKSLYKIISITIIISTSIPTNITTI